MATRRRRYFRPAASEFGIKTAQTPGQTGFPGVTGEFISALFVFFAVDGKQI
jgi:hypothetical protein